jgi:IS1 family transposase
MASSRDVVFGTPTHISTSYVERQNLTLRMSQRRSTRLTNGFSKTYLNHCAAVALYVTHHNLCRVHEALRVTPAMQLYERLLQREAQVAARRFARPKRSNKWARDELERRLDRLAAANAAYRVPEKAV